jgi:hypothetical protein
MRTTGVTKEVRMRIKSLPSNPSLEHLKYQARDLLDAQNQGNAEAVARVREFHPGFARVSDDEIRASKLSLADAQLVIAREYGFPSWPKLKRHIEVSAQGAFPAVGALSGPPAGPVELKQKWPQGARIVKEMDLKQIMQIQTLGKSNPREHKLYLTSQYAYTVARELPGGSREVELQHLSFKMEYESGDGFLWQYDSGRTSAVNESPVSDLFKTIMDAKVRYFLDANNQVERMEGVDELVKRLNVLQGAKLKPGMTWDNKALDKVVNRIISGAQRPLEGVAAGLRIMYSKDHFTNRVDSSFLPGNAVQPGDSWSYSREWRKQSLLNVGIVRDCTVTFQGWEMRGARLCSRLEFRGTEKARLVHQSEGKVMLPITDGTFDGVVWFDPESGRGIETNSNHDFKVTRQGRVASLPDPAGAGGSGVTTDQHHQVITEKLVSVEGPGGSS